MSGQSAETVVNVLVTYFTQTGRSRANKNDHPEWNDRFFAVQQ
jgi:hypothetical protein